MPTERLFLAEESDFTFATELLTACVANAAIRKSHVARLIELVDPAKWTDVDNKAGGFIFFELLTEKFYSKNLKNQNFDIKNNNFDFITTILTEKLKKN